MSNHVVAVNIVRQPSPFAPQDARTSTKSFVRLEGSVADLRKALLDDQVIQPGDKFYGFNGQPISNNSELHTTWTDALQGILVVGAEDTPAPAEPVVHRPCVHQMHAPVASAQLHIHAPTVKAIKVPQLIFNSGESDVSETKTLTEACVTPVNKPSCICTAHQVANSPPIVVVPPVDTISTVVEVLEVLPAPQVLPEPKPQVVVEPAPVVLEVFRQEETTPLDCPCEACQNGVITTPVVVEPLVVAKIASNVLQESEKAALIIKSGLGYGININSEAGPLNTALSVTSQVTFENVEFNPTTDSDRFQKITVTSSTRETAYTKSGWTETCLNVDHPWVTRDVISTADDELKTVSATGRYLTSKYTLTLSGEVKAHPDFENAIRAALEIENAARRSEELGRVFSQYGHVYVAAVEFGGMKHTTITRTLSRDETEGALVDEIKLALDQAFAPQEINDCPCPDCANRVTVSSTASDIFETVGGVADIDDDIIAWQASLASLTNWAVTRTLRVESVINLFDEVTRAKILAVVPQAVIELETPTPVITTVEPLTKVPLHRLFSPRSGIHFYTTKATEVDNAVRVRNYNYETLAAHILSEETECTVPLYRIHRGIKHLYTIDLNEKEAVQANSDVHVGHGVVGYVHATQQPGTVPLYRIFNPRTDAHLFTTNINEKESLLKVGWADEGVSCYVYL